MNVTSVPALASVTDGAPMASVGTVLSTLKVLEGPTPEAVFPAASAAVPLPTVMDVVPSPVQDVSVIVRVVVPVPLTALEHEAVPVSLTVISEFAKVTEVAPE